MTEVWKDIKGYEGLYQVSNFGNVVRNGRVLKAGLASNGYLTVALCKEGYQKTKLIHVLVAQAFIPNVRNKEQVNHIDECKINNKADNLEWVSRKENANHGTRNARVAEIKSIPVGQYNLNQHLIKTWRSMIEVERILHISNANISACCSGKRKSAGGYVWRYVDA